MSRSRTLAFVLGQALLLVSGIGVSCRESGEPESIATVGRLEGSVRWTATEIPEPTWIANATDPEVCGARHSLEDIVIDGESGAVGGVILALVDVPTDKLPPLESETLVIDNRECRFEPHVAVATLGTTLEALNSDQVLHTTHLYGPRESNISLPVKGIRSKRTLTEPGLVLIKCDIHGWMQAFVRVDPHPFHDVTDRSGRFSISDIPPGSYTLELWHERFGRGSERVEIRPGETTRLDLAFPLSPEGS